MPKETKKKSVWEVLSKHPVTEKIERKWYKDKQGKPYTTADFSFERNDKTVDLLMVDIKDKSILQVCERCHIAS